MKKFNILISALLAMCIVDGVHAKNINWYVDDSVYDTSTCSSGGDLILPTTPTKRGYTFMGWKISYTPIEYLESTGTQYIDTGFKPNQDTRVIMEYSATNTFGIGTRTSYGVAAYTVFQGGSDGTMFFSDHGEQRLQTDITISNAKALIDKNKNNTILIRNSETLANFTHTPVTFQTVYNLPLFGLNTGGMVDPYSGKIYSFKLYDNGTLIRDMIPVLDLAGVPCMYDKVSKQYFYNAGTGSFIAGPVL